MSSGSESLEQKVASFPYWHYEFDLDGVRTPIRYPEFANRHRQRKRYFFDPLIAACGGSLAGRRVLDLGCNAGFWSLAALEAGCDFVVSIDGRRTHIEQASLVLETKGVDPQRYRLVEDDVFTVDLEALGPFDVVLCLGLLYHVSKHVSLLERVAAVNRDLLVIDSTLVGMPGSFVHWKRERIEDPRSAVRDTVVGYPTKEAVVMWTSALGYQTRILRPRFDDWSGGSDYRWGMRRAFLCSRDSSVDGIGIEDRNSSTSQILDPLRYLVYKAGKRLRGNRV